VLSPPQNMAYVTSSLVFLVVLQYKEQKRSSISWQDDCTKFCDNLSVTIKSSKVVMIMMAKSKNKMMFSSVMMESKGKNTDKNRRRRKKKKTMEVKNKNRLF